MVEDVDQSILAEQNNKAELKKKMLSLYHRYVQDLKQYVQHHADDQSTYGFLFSSGLALAFQLRKNEWK